MIRNILQEELQTKEVVLQEIVSSNLKVTNERLEKLSGEFSDTKEVYNLPRNNLKTKQR